MVVEGCSVHHQQTESSQTRQEGMRLDSQEALIGASILGSVSMVLMQSSTQLFQVRGRERGRERKRDGERWTFNFSCSIVYMCTCRWH